MTCRRTFNCDFCRGAITDASAGFGVKWTGNGTLAPVSLHDAETHLCNLCCKALPTLFDALAKGYAA